MEPTLWEKIGSAAFNWHVLSPVIIVTAALVYIGLERRFPYDPRHKFFRDGFWVDFFWYSIVQSLILSQVISFIIRGLDNATGWAQEGLISGWPVWLQVVFFLVVHDCYIYFFHRWQHRNPVLWRIHEAHHSVKAVDWVAGSRSHSFEILINQTIEFAPIVLLGAHPDVPLIKATIDAVWGMWIHSNIDVRSGILQYVINGPEMHRWHHAVEDEHGQNFGTKFAFWDWMFGTAYLPGHKPAGYGIRTWFPKNYWSQHTYMFRPLSEDRPDPDADARMSEPCPDRRTYKRKRSSDGMRSTAQPAA